jgi:hypothetical protein
VAIDFEFEALLRSATKTDTTVLAATDHLANEVRDYAKGLAPVFGDRDPRRGSPAHGEPEDYKNSIKVTAHPTEPLGRRVISTDFKALWIEVGNRHMPEYAVFTKTAAYFGGTPPILNEGVRDAQHHLRGELEKLAKLSAMSAVGLKSGIEKSRALTEQKHAVNRARNARSAAFKAARQPRGKGRRRR